MLDDISSDVGYYGNTIEGSFAPGDSGVSGGTSSGSMSGVYSSIGEMPDFADFGKLFKEGLAAAASLSAPSVGSGSAEVMKKINPFLGQGQFIGQTIGQAKNFRSTVNKSKLGADAFKIPMSVSKSIGKGI